MGGPEQNRCKPVVAVGGVVVLDGRALLVRRSKEPLRGQWSIPGGALEPGESLEKGVEREMLEETGLNVRVGELLEVVERVFDDASGNLQYHYVILDYFCQALNSPPRPGGDVSELALVRENDMAAYHLSDAVLGVLRKAFALAQRSAGYR